MAPIARTSQKNVWTKVPLPSNFEQMLPSPRQAEMTQMVGKGRGSVDHALASWLPCCAATRTSSRRGAMRTQQLSYTLRKPTDSREGIDACVACGQCPVEGFRVPSLCEHGQSVCNEAAPGAARTRCSSSVFYMATHLTEPASRATFMALDRTPCPFMSPVFVRVTAYFERGLGATYTSGT